MYLILVCILSTLVFGETPVQQNGALRVDTLKNGAFLVNTQGEPVQLRGMSTHGLQWFDDLYTEDAVQALAEGWNADVFRISLYPLEGGYIHGDTARWRRRVDELVSFAGKYGMYTIIDWHMLVPGDPGHEDYGDHAAAFFEYMAQKHGQKKHVIFEICNEPNDHGLDYEVTWDEHVKPYAEDIIPRIRAHSDNIIIVGTPKWSARPNHVIDSPLEYDNVLYSLHFYAASHTYERGDSQWHYMDNLRTAAEAGIPVFVTEFGMQEYTGDGHNDFEASQHWLDSLAAYNISWCNWNFSDDHRSGAVLKENAVTTQSSPENFSDTAHMKESGVWIRNQLRRSD
ncbi:MAG: glycoside hydrolase family 5 protein [Fibrobacterota bacterium]